jgi:hypothetical protein
MPAFSHETMGFFSGLRRCEPAKSPKETGMKDGDEKQQESMRDYMRDTVSCGFTEYELRVADFALLGVWHVITSHDHVT